MSHKQLMTNSDFNRPEYFKHEIFLDQERWQNIPDNKLPLYEYNHSRFAKKKIDAIQRLIIPYIKEIITSSLTRRQQEVVIMYFLHDKTQVIIAQKLRISQPTVSQHLNGKKRNGKLIGGSIRKIRKIIHQMSSTQRSHKNDSHIMNTLDQLLDPKMSYRKSHVLLRGILK